MTRADDLADDLAGRRLARPCTRCSRSLMACSTVREGDGVTCCASCSHPRYDDQETP